MDIRRFVLTGLFTVAFGSAMAGSYEQDLPGQELLLGDMPKSETDAGTGGYTLSAQWVDERGRDVQVIEINGQALAVIDISSGPRHSCAITLRGEPMCWGDNSDGQLGDNTTETRLRPVKMYGVDEPVISISAGYGHTCLVTETGKPMCSGLNDEGQIGDGTDIDILYPAAVAIQHRAANISAGRNHSCLTTTDGAAYCWGSNNQGQLGSASKDSSLEPVPVIGMEAAVFSVSAGNLHSCATGTDGGVLCWGDLTTQW